MTEAISNFLDATCELTPRWFNKPKFHILLHLPDHVRRFGPPMLFATEGFESFNAVIRSHSIHSNHRAPSRDIAAGMAHHNRIRHLLSGGFFIMPRVRHGRPDEDVLNVPLDSLRPSIYSSRSAWLAKMCPSTFTQRNWRCIGPDPITLLSLDGFDVNVLGLIRTDQVLGHDDWGTSSSGNLSQCQHFSSHDRTFTGACRKLGRPVSWAETQGGKCGLHIPIPGLRPSSKRFRSAEKVCLPNGDWCGC